MKFTLFLSVLFITSLGFGQYEVNYENIGSLKLGATVAEVSKLCGKTLTIPADEFSVEFDITISGSEYHITFQEEEVEKVKSMSLHRISVKDPKFKTKEGAKIGMTKSELLNLYKDFYSFEMTRFLDTENFDYPTNKLMFVIDKKNNKATIDFEDFSEFRILFLIVDNVVKEIQILDGFFI
jgi:uncharacterized lipoprotein YehR (DUF1307 family)